MKVASKPYKNGKKADEQENKRMHSTVEEP